MSELFQIDRSQPKAYLMINCEDGSEEYVLDEIRTIPEIRESTLTIGRHDVLALIQAHTIDDLKDVIALKIRKIPQVCSTTTLVCIGKEI